ncbi:MAG TPA: DUF3368 domain-containing protein [bacterium]|nr:DUF3368 domain-containing protein [bacterium]HQL63632.1 DUF3368 domain-containing protein [bacterium]
MIEWVVNSSPIIVLSRLGFLERLDAILPQFLVPSGVMAEINAGPTGNPATAWIGGLGTSRMVNVSAISPAIAGWDLGRGESEVLTWSCEHKECGAILDDYAARKCAVSLGIPLCGTLGLLILAKRRGVIDQISPVLDELPRVGFWIHESLVAEAKRLTGE